MAQRGGGEDAVVGILYGIGKAIGYVLIGIFALIYYGVSALIPKKPFFIPFAARFEHTHIVAGSGHGKTQMLIHQIVTEDLPAVERGERSVIVIDSQGDMIRDLLSLAELSPSKRSLSERLVYIDPTDIEYPPCLNLFDFGLDRLSGYAPLEREKLLNGAVFLYEYLFGSLLGAELTSRQGVIFRYVARLLMVIPDATIYTLLDIMDDPTLVRKYIHLLDPVSKRFFETHFQSSMFDTTRMQIAMRLLAVLSTDLVRLFSHRENRLNLFRAMNRGSLILINTAKDLLKPEGCSIFGRFMIALISQATQERAAIREERRKPTFVYIDECHDYLEEGEGIETLLNTARKYFVGLVLSHQNLGQLSRRLSATIMASTAIKMAGGVSADDTLAIAREMRADPAFISGMVKSGMQTKFALSVRNVTTNGPVEQVVPLGYLNSRPRMNREELKKLLADNRNRYCAPVDYSLINSSPAVSHAGNAFSLGVPQPL